MIRYIPGVKPPIDLGPTNQDSFSGSSTILIISDDYRYTAGAGKELFSPFVAAPQTYEFLLGQPDQNRYAKLGTNRFVVDTTKRVEGATNQQTDPIPGVTENPNGWFEALTRAFNELNPRIQGPNEQLDGPTTQQSYEFKPNQPEWNRYNQVKQWNRFVVDAVKRFEGATTQQTYEFFPNQPEATRYEKLKQFNRFIVGATPQFDGPTVQQTYEFQPNQPEQISYFRKNLLRYVVDAAKSLENQVTPQNYEFLVGSPDQARYDKVRQFNRFLVETVKRFEGATVQQNYEFPVNQPDRTRYDRLKQTLRFIVNPVPRFESTPQQTYEFLLGQPPRGRVDINRFKLIGPTPQLDGAVRQQMFEFLLGQPPRGQADLNRWLRTGSKPQLETFARQTFDFWYTTPDARWRVPPKMGPLPTFISPPPVVDTFNPYVPTFPRRDWFPRYRDPKFNWIPILDGTTLATPCMAIAVIASDGTVQALFGVDDTQVTLGAADDTVQALLGLNESTSVLATDESVIAIIGTDGTIIFRKGIC